MSFRTVYTEVRKALEALGYDLNKHTYCVVVRPNLCPSQCEVQLDSKYFGVWDTNRKTFVD